jgi:ferric-chelate reductase
MYLIRARSGQTQKLTTLSESTIPTILAGPYGISFPHQDTSHLLAIAGGSGVSFTLPVVQELLLRSSHTNGGKEGGGGVIDFIWIIRHHRDLLWIAEELASLKSELKENLGLRIKIFVTREAAAAAAAAASSSSLEQDEKSAAVVASEAAAETSSSSSEENLSNPEKSAQSTTLQTITSSQKHDLSSLLLPPSPSSSSRFTITFLSHAHPNLSEIVNDFRERCSEPTHSVSRFGQDSSAVEIVGSGPEDMGRDLRLAVAAGRGVGGAEGERFHWDGRE